MPQAGDDGIPLIANSSEDFDVVKRLLDRALRRLRAQPRRRRDRRHRSDAEGLPLRRALARDGPLRQPRHASVDAAPRLALAGPKASRLRALAHRRDRRRLRSLPLRPGGARRRRRRPRSTRGCTTSSNIWRSCAAAPRRWLTDARQRAAAHPDVEGAARAHGSRGHRHRRAAAVGRHAAQSPLVAVAVLPRAARPAPRSRAAPRRRARAGARRRRRALIFGRARRRRLPPDLPRAHAVRAARSTQGAAPDERPAKQ